MAHTLVLKIDPPMQSWGADDRFIKSRRTNRFPTKSGIVGLIAASLGWDRTHDLMELATLRMGVRIDSPGSMDKDFQTTRKSHSYKSKKKKEEQEISDRYFLQDSVFIIGIQDDSLEYLHEIEWALHHPAFNLFAGRKSFPLNDDFIIGIMEDSSIEDVFNTLEWKGAPHVSGDVPVKLETLIDYDDNADGNDVLMLNDYPLSFALNHREWSLRRINRSWVPVVVDGTNTSGSDDYDDYSDEDMFLLGERV